MCSVISHLKFSCECQDPFSYSGHPGLRLATSHWGLGIWSAFWTPTLLLAIVLCLILSPSCVLPQGTKVTPRNENENCVGWTIDAGLLKQRVEHLVPAFLGRDPTYVSTFLGTYPTFTTNKEVLEVLFM
ncbi:Hypothetical predicted protein, partial [Lynx pardinus]